MDTASKVERPYIIKLICILGFLGVLATLYWIITGIPFEYEVWYLLYLYVYTALRLVFLGGIWWMRKWAANGYTVLAVLNVVLLFYLSGDFLFELIVSAVVIFILLKNYSKMK